MNIQIVEWERLHTDLGFSLIPLSGKIPIETGWQKWGVEKRPFKREDFIGRNCGICCGPASGIIVLDIDDFSRFEMFARHNGFTLPSTREHATGNGGFHRLYIYPLDGRKYGNRSFKEHGFDIRGIGGQVVAPGSEHPETGRRYAVSMDIAIVDAPDWLLDLALRKEPTCLVPGGRGPVDLDKLPITKHVKDKIRRVHEKGFRSEASMSVLLSLLRSGIDTGTIYDIFEQYLIGEKYREKKAGRWAWLAGEIERARRHIEEGVPGEANDCPDEEEKSAIPPFPDIMTGLAGGFARLYSTYLEVPPHFLYISFLTCLGSVISERVTLDSELSTQPRLYTLLLGESADARKSTAIKKTVSFFQAVLNHGSFPILEGVGSAEGLQKKLDEDGHLLLCLDEFKSFVSKCKIESSVLLPCVTTLFEGNDYANWTKKQKVELRNVHLSLLAASTTHTFEQCWDGAFTDIGFNNRLFVVPGSGQKRFSIPRQIPDDEKKALRDRVGKMLRIYPSGTLLEITPKARELYHAWYMDCERSVHNKRLDTYAMRFMILLAVSESKIIVDEDIVDRVIQLMDWQLKVRRIHDPVDADNLIARTEEKIRRLLSNGEMSERQLKRGVHYERIGLWIFETTMKNLRSAKEIVLDKKTRRYRLA